MKSVHVFALLFLMSYSLTHSMQNNNAQINLKKLSSEAIITIASSGTISAAKTLLSINNFSDNPTIISNSKVKRDNDRIIVRIKVPRKNAHQNLGLIEKAKTIRKNGIKRPEAAFIKIFDLPKKK